jgi:vacuolar protein sorting-associated protein VTA1
MSINVPDVLKAIKPYVTLASQLEDKEKIVSYYCRLYAIQSGMKINKSAAECKQFLMKMMDLLEKTKVTLKNEEAMKSEVVGQAYVERYTLGLFVSADADDRAARFNMNLVKRFYTVGLLFDVLAYFGELSEEMINKKDYAKRKAVYIKKCLENGETPIAGPPDESNETISGNEGYNETVTAYSQSNETTTITTSTSTSKTLADKTDIITQAEKLCKYASNALQYEDIPTAIDNLEKCLRILKSTQ